MRKKVKITEGSCEDATYEKYFIILYMKDREFNEI